MTDKEEVVDRLTGEDKIRNAICGICGNSSSYDKQSLKGSTWTINGVKIILCCPCEDDLFDGFVKARLNKAMYDRIAYCLGGDEKEDFIDAFQRVYYKNDWGE